MRTDPGLGELLRHLIDLTDGSTDKTYKQLDFAYRPRYTPLMRVLETGPCAVSEIKQRLNVTQGAVSQTIKLMLEDGLIEKIKGEDARQSIISLSPHGQQVVEKLSPHWQAIFKAIKGLEDEINMPLLSCLNSTVEALEYRSFASRITQFEEAAAEQPEKQPAADNLFNSDSNHYATFRPVYPAELAQSLAELARDSSLAIDVGCGNGQLTTLLSPYFDQVIGFDSSKNQIAHAQPAANVEYRHQSAETLALDDNSVDLIVVAQAAHWFKLDQFYAEARRVAKTDALLALVSYGVPYIQDPINSIFQQGYWQDIHQYWPAERRHVENGYRDLYFPFQQLDLPGSSYQKEVSLQEFISYIKTWTAFKVATKSHAGAESFEAFFQCLSQGWPEGENKQLVWPISIKATRL